jgi:RNA polymerase sigma-70 factor, ECF subfamily
MVDVVAVRADARRHVAATSRDRRFENLLDRHERRLRRVIFGMLGDPNRVEDVLQEALIRAYRALPASFGNERLESAWLYRIVHRCCLNELRSRRRRPESPGLPAEHLFASAAEAEDALELAEALAELPAQSRAVLLLVDVLGFDYETAAAALRVPRGTVASRLHAARARLREVLE